MKQNILAGRTLEPIAVPVPLLEYFTKQGPGPDGDVLAMLKLYEDAHGYMFDWGHIVEEEHEVGPYRSVVWRFYVNELAWFALHQAGGDFHAVCEGAHIGIHKLLAMHDDLLDIAGDPCPRFGLFSFWAWAHKRVEVATLLEVDIINRVQEISAFAMTYASRHLPAQDRVAA